MAHGHHEVMLVGLGRTGVAIGQALDRRTDCSVVAGVDIDPGRVGADLGQLLTGTPSGTRVAADVGGPEGRHADIAVVTTTSRLAALEPLATTLLSRGLHVVSICEELGYPHISHRAIAERLDHVAVANGVALLGTGCNPGFLMDTLPLAFSGLRQHVDRVQIRRTAEMSGYGALLRKFGLGLTVEEFNAAQVEGSVVGHVGFEQSVAALAAGLGWRIDDIEVDPVRPAFTAPAARHAPHIDIAPSTVAAVIHCARALRDDDVVIDLQIHFGIFEDGDPVELGDHWLIDGDGTPLEIRSLLGSDSHEATVAVTSNVTTVVPELRPGLRSMAELPVLALASKGTRLVSPLAEGTPS